MKNLIFPSILLISVFFFYSCQDSGPTIPQNPPSSNNAPDFPAHPSPPDSSENVSRLVTLSWTCTDPDAGDSLKFNIYIGTVNPPDVLIAQDLINTTYVVGLLPANTTHFWRIVAKDNHGAVRSGNIWRFKTGA